HELMTDEEDRHITFGNYDSVSLEDDLYAVATDGNMNYFFGVDSIPYKFTDAGTSCFDFTFCKSEINEPGMAAARIKGNKSKVIKEIER
ncbi:MAG: hypothetical protein RR595_09455, partial [Lysinibacillus sp.]